MAPDVDALSTHAFSTTTLLPRQRNRKPRTLHLESRKARLLIHLEAPATYSAASVLHADDRLSEVAASELALLPAMLSAFTARPIIELRPRDKSKIETILAHGAYLGAKLRWRNL